MRDLYHGSSTSSQVGLLENNRVAFGKTSKNQTSALRDAQRLMSGTAIHVVPAARAARDDQQCK